MKRPPKLDAEEIARRLTSLPMWTLRDGALHRELKFPSFSAALGFLVRGGLAAEKLDHHPSWSNSYSSVVIDLSTHDVSGITELDFQLATELEALAPE